MATPHPAKKARDKEPSMIKDGATQNSTRVHPGSDLCLSVFKFFYIYLCLCMRVHKHT